MNVRVIIEEIKKSLDEDRNYFKHKNIMLIGENNSGKSKIIKTLIRDLLKKQKKIYFIDSPNRNIPTRRSDLHTGFDQLDLIEIVKTRIQDKYFNREDIFDDNHRKEIVLKRLLKIMMKLIRIYVRNSIVMI